MIFGGKIGSSWLVSPDADGKIVLPSGGRDGWQFWPKFPPQQYQRLRELGQAVAALT